MVSRRSELAQRDSAIVTVLLVVDTAGVRMKYPALGQKSNKVVQVSPSLIHKAASGAPVDSGQGTMDLNIAIGREGRVRFFAISGSNQFEDAVFLCRVEGSDGDSLVEYQECIRSTVLPRSRATPLPARTGAVSFSFCETRIRSQTSKELTFLFALYTRSATTGRPEFAGYFSAWSCPVW